MALTHSGIHTIVALACALMLATEPHAQVRLEAARVPIPASEITSTRVVDAVGFADVGTYVLTEFYTSRLGAFADESRQAICYLDASGRLRGCDTVARYMTPTPGQLIGRAGTDGLIYLTVAQRATSDYVDTIHHRVDRYVYRAAERISADSLWHRNIALPGYPLSTDLFVQGDSVRWVFNDSTTIERPHLLSAPVRAGPVHTRLLDSALARFPLREAWISGDSLTVHTGSYDGFRRRAWRVSLADSPRSASDVTSRLSDALSGALPSVVVNERGEAAVSYPRSSGTFTLPAEPHPVWTAPLPSAWSFYDWRVAGDSVDLAIATEVVYRVSLANFGRRQILLDRHPQACCLDIPSLTSGPGGQTLLYTTVVEWPNASYATRYGIDAPLRADLFATPEYPFGAWVTGDLHALGLGHAENGELVFLLSDTVRGAHAGRWAAPSTHLAFDTLDGVAPSFRYAGSSATRLEQWTSGGRRGVLRPVANAADPLSYRLAWVTYDRRGSPEDTLYGDDVARLSGGESFGRVDSSDEGYVTSGTGELYVGPPATLLQAAHTRVVALPPEVSRVHDVARFGDTLRVLATSRSAELWLTYDPGTTVPAGHIQLELPNSSSRGAVARTPSGAPRLYLLSERRGVRTLRAYAPRLASGPILLAEHESDLPGAPRRGVSLYGSGDGILALAWDDSGDTLVTVEHLGFDALGQLRRHVASVPYRHPVLVHEASFDYDTRSLAVSTSSAIAGVRAADLLRVSLRAAVPTRESVARRAARLHGYVEPGGELRLWGVPRRAAELTAAAAGGRLVSHVPLVAHSSPLTLARPKNLPATPTWVVVQVRDRANQPCGVWRGLW